MQTTPDIFRIVIVSAALIATGPLSAQVAPQAAAEEEKAPTSSAGPVTEKEEVVVLSPFTVNAEEDSGYQAISSLAGSRMNTKLKDTAASISVMTEEFLKDIGAFDLSDALRFGNNLQFNNDDDAAAGNFPAGNPTIELPQSYRVRGLPATKARNGFEWKLSSDTYNVERIEDSRGPNSILFGIGTAGGVINVTTKQAKLNRTASAVQFGAGSRDSWRTVVDHNQVLLNKKLAVRLSAVWNRTNNYRLFSFQEAKRFHLATKYQLAERTQLRAEFQYDEVDENVPRGNGMNDYFTAWIYAGRPTFGLTAPATGPTGFTTLYGGARLGANQPRYVSNTGQLIEMGDTLPGTPNNGQIRTSSNGTGNFPVLDPALMNLRINTGGRGQDRSNDSHATTIFLEQRLGKKTFLEIGYNHQEYDWLSYDPQFSNEVRFDPNTTWPGTLGANPFADRVYLETYWRLFDRSENFDTGRASFASEFDAGKAGLYRFAAVGEYEKRDFYAAGRWEVWEGRPFNVNPENNLNKVWHRNYVTEGDWDTYYVEGPQDIGLLNGVTDQVTGATRSSHWVASDDQHDSATQKAGLVSLQSIYFDGGLVVGTGYRVDKLYVTDRGIIRDPVTLEYHTDYDPATVQHYDFTGKTKTLGIVAHPTKVISLLYNQSSNIGLPDVRIRVLPDLRTAPPTDGKGQDYGIGLDLLDGKVYARAVRYTTEEQGAVTFGLASGNGFAGTSGLIADALFNAGLITEAERLVHNKSFGNGSTRDSESEGYEFSLTGNPTRSLRLSVNFSITDSVDTKVAPEVVEWWATEGPYFKKFDQNIITSGTKTIGVEIAEFETALATALSVEGYGRIGNRKHKANFVARYTFNTGRLKGAFIGGNYSYQGKMLLGLATIDNVPLQPVWGDPVGEAAMFLGFNVPMGDKQKMRVQLNIMNLLNETDYIVNRRLLSGTFPVRNITIRTPRSWRLTADYSF